MQAYCSAMQQMEQSNILELLVSVDYHEKYLFIYMAVQYFW